MEKKTLSLLMLLSVSRCLASNVDTDMENMQLDQGSASQESSKLNEFSQGLRDICPVGVDQSLWDANLLSPLQGFTDIALVGSPETVEDQKAMIETVGESCKAQCKTFLENLENVGMEITDDIKEPVSEVCTHYVKRVTDDLVSKDVDRGNEEQVHQIMDDFTEQENDQEDMHVGEMEVQPTDDAEDDVMQTAVQDDEMPVEDDATMEESQN